jgi:formylglycine-generating enzyme required for sulfatase activity
MITIPTTTFKMGSPVEPETSTYYRPEEKPQHDVTVNEFAIGRFLVTAEEFCQFLNAEGNHQYFHEDFIAFDFRTIKKEGDRYVPQKGAERCPAKPVTWVGADAYCKWLTRTLGKPYRLPTEVEWELTARGKELRKWPWGDEPPVQVWDIKPLLPWSLVKREREGIRLLYSHEPGFKQTPFYAQVGLRFYDVRPDSSRTWLAAPVGSFPLNATPDGVYDMMGYHYGEWCADKFDEQAYSRTDPNSDTTDSDELLRSMRGSPRVRIRAFRQDNIVLRVAAVPLLKDAAGGQEITGRSWSREGQHPINYPGIFRVAMSVGNSENEGGSKK